MRLTLMVKKVSEAEYTMLFIEMQELIKIYEES